MSDLDEIVDIQIALSDVAPSASSGGGDSGGGSPSGNVQVNTGNNKVQVNLDGSGKIEVVVS